MSEQKKYELSIFQLSIMNDETKGALVYALVCVMDNYILSASKQEEVIYPNGLSIPDGLLEDILRSVESKLD